eukprot:12247435-Prorocentrum_lima.AAC.1
MTSSLVGSEMCIRDRVVKQSRILSSWRAPLIRSTLPKGTLYTWVDAPTPVSYTHLTLPTICSV